MNAADQVRAFRDLVHQREGELVRTLTEDAFNAIRDGDAVTGAAGQPVDDGDLYKSWTMGFDNDANPRVGIVSSDAAHANAIEQGVNPHGPVHFHGTGGPGSVAAVVHGFPRLLDAALVKVVGNG